MGELQKLPNIADKLDDWTICLNMLEAFLGVIRKELLMEPTVPSLPQGMVTLACLQCQVLTTMKVQSM